MDARTAGFGLLAAVVLERGVELAVSARNARRALAAGGIEHGRGHYPPMVAFHTLFLAACAVEPLVPCLQGAPGAPSPPAPPWPAAVTAGAAALVVLAQALRWWAVAALGGRWTTRVVVLPGEPLVTRGPYRFLRHPNYLAVAVELAALPLALGAWRTAIAATLGNAALMAVRIPAEERALGLRAEAPGSPLALSLSKGERSGRSP